MSRPIDPDVTIDHLRSLFRYDPVTGVVTNRVRRNYKAPAGAEIGTEFENAKGQKYRRVRIGRKMVLVHRLVWFMETGAWPEGEIDHVNGDGRDNRWENLRDVTASQNKANLVRLKRNNQSGVQGVCFDTRKLVWVAQLNCQGRRVDWSTHGTREAAATARRAAERAYFPGIDFSHSSVEA